MRRQVHRFCALQLLISSALFVWLYNSHCGAGRVAVHGTQGPAAQVRQKSQTSLWCDFLLSLQMECFCQSEGHCDCLRQRCQPRIIPQPSPQEQNRISTIHFLFLRQNGIISKRQSLVVPAALEKSKDNHYEKIVKEVFHLYPSTAQNAMPSSN